jgi:N-acetylmuramoyl-L-alanine amidase
MRADRHISRYILPVNISKKLNTKQMNKLVITLDAGHGKDYQGKNSPELSNYSGVRDESVIEENRFHEYLFNRKIAKMLIERCASEEWIEVFNIVPELNDISLGTRKARINAINPDLSISLHSNAAGMGNKWMNARGFCIYTDYGQNLSDKYAQIIFDNVKAILTPEMSFRQELQDGDSDYEAGFAMVRVVPPSVLIECGFYDNEKDLSEVMSEKFQENYVSALYNSLIDIAKSKGIF